MWTMDFGRYALSNCVAAALLAGCVNHSRAAQGFAANYTFRPPSPTPTWPSFSAKDYRSFHKRTLTRGEVSLIRKTLALVKPCQRPLLRFAFPSDGGPDFPFVLFFSDKFWPHVLWTNNMYFKNEEGSVFPGPSGAAPVPWNGIRYDVDHETCP
jgi:hypothetical protein